MQYVKNGQTKEFRIDLHRIVQMEQENPDFDFIKSMAKLSEGFRLSDIVMLCTFIGTDFEKMTAEGYTIPEIVKIVTKCIEELGFISE